MSSPGKRKEKKTEREDAGEDSGLLIVFSIGNKMTGCEENPVLCRYNGNSMLMKFQLHWHEIEISWACIFLLPQANDNQSIKKEFFYPAEGTDFLYFFYFFCKVKSGNKEILQDNAFRLEIFISYIFE